MGQLSMDRFFEKEGGAAKKKARRNFRSLAGPQRRIAVLGWATLDILFQTTTSIIQYLA